MRKRKGASAHASILPQHFCPSPMDIPMEGVYLLWHVQRKNHRDAKIGSSPGNARPDGAEGPRRARPAARLWHRPPDRAGKRTGPAIERRNGLHLAPATPAAEMDRYRVGNIGKQPQGEILFDHQKRP